MSRTVVLGYAKKEDAIAMAANYSNDHAVMVVGPTDQVLMARETDDGIVWRSGPTADLFVMIATKDPIERP
ncbi:hypothetical protein [Novosphingobium sp. KACC 22771]|uniref:hypothetical protein n=1 Tax=Novosphingobium sp. KACC 22771 TaxID=3025670 RepID=UPI00236524F9|nr:hypothetical protein [Novosphingobium sp. KACC 22771]WDF72310.1 hypothetical protein PQ467_16210 [Novosphingobium sp. KACC 22771]